MMHILMNMKRNCWLWYSKRVPNKWHNVNPQCHGSHLHKHMQMLFMNSQGGYYAVVGIGARYKVYDVLNTLQTEKSCVRILIAWCLSVSGDLSVLSS